MRLMTLVKQLFLTQLFVKSRGGLHLQFRMATGSGSHLYRSESGSTAVEYAIMLGLICTVLLASVQSVGKNSAATIDKISTALRNAADEAPTPKELGVSRPTGGTTK